MQNMTPSDDMTRSQPITNYSTEFADWRCGRPTLAELTRCDLPAARPLRIRSWPSVVV